RLRQPRPSIVQIRRVVVAVPCHHYARSSARPLPIPEFERVDRALHLPISSPDRARSEPAPALNLSLLNAYRLLPFLSVLRPNRCVLCRAPLATERLCCPSFSWPFSPHHSWGGWAGAPRLRGQARTTHHSQALRAQCQVRHWRSR